MRTDAEIRSEGLRLLTEAMGSVEAERFIALINRERFDYTEWRQTQWGTDTVASLAQRARAMQKKNADPAP
jgi:hypothetical protein